MASMERETIDGVLGEFIMEHPDTKILGYMFQKEKEGVYLFGSKRVTIKLERGHLMIRAGGGYLTID